MKNLEQIRALHALETARKHGEDIVGKENGEVIKKIPPLIMNHGLLAVGAYAMDPKNSGYKAAFDAIAEHLAAKEISLIPPECGNTEGLMKYLTEQADSSQLRLCTAEAMAWLNYARRFIRPKDNKGI